MVVKGRAIAHFLRKLVIINIFAQSTIPNQKYVKNFGVNGHTGLGKKEYLLRLNVVGLIKLKNWVMDRLIIVVAVKVSPAQYLYLFPANIISIHSLTLT